MKILRIVFSLIIVFAVLFGATQIFQGEVEAALWTCGNSLNCDSHGGECDGTLKCWCHDKYATTFYFCWPSEPVANQ